MAFLRAHRTQQNQERLRLGDLWQDHDLVFPNRVGKPLDHGNLYYREYKPLLQKAGLGDEGFTFHSLRDTFTTELFNQRKRPKIIQSLLGHSSIVQTMTLTPTCWMTLTTRRSEGSTRLAAKLPCLGLWCFRFLPLLPDLFVSRF